MQKIKIGLRNRTMADQFEICGHFVNTVAKVPEEKRRLVRMEELQTKRARAENSEAEVRSLESQLKTAILRRKTDLTDYCRAVACGATAIGLVAESTADLFAAGLQVELPKSPIGLAGAPTQLRFMPVNLSGAVKLRWKRPVRRCVFTVEMTTDPEALNGWIQVGPKTFPCSASKIISGLQPGVLYWFRVCAHNAAGQGPWSQYVSVRPAR